MTAALSPPSRARARVFDESDSDPRKKLARLSVKAMSKLEDILDTGEPREQTEAARALLQAWAKFGEVERDNDSDEAKLARLREMVQNPPPWFLGVLDEAGITLVMKGKR